MIIIYAIILLLAIGIAFFAYAWFRGKRDEDRTVTWVRDWEEY